MSQALSIPYISTRSTICGLCRTDISLAEGENTYKLWRSPDGKWEECDYGEAFFFPTKTDGGIYTSALDFLKWKKALYSGKVIGDSAFA